jgi:glycerol kinase
MQFQSDILGTTILRPSDTEATARGAAFLAGLSTGFWDGLAELRTLPTPVTRFEPAMEQALRSSRIDAWHDALRRIGTKGDMLPSPELD